MRFITIIIILFASSALSYAYEGTFGVCTERSSGLDYDKATGMLYLICKEDNQLRYLNVLDPETLIIDKTFQFDGKICGAMGLNNGSSLLIGLSDYDANPNNEDSKLIEIDYTTGNTLHELLLDQMILSVITDSSQNYAYLRVGRNRWPKIIKVSLSTFQVTNEVVFGELSSGIEITSDEGEIYVDSANIYPEQSDAGIQGLGTFETSDLDMITRFTLPSPPRSMAINNDGSKLFVSATNYFETDFGGDLFIIDTQNNQIEEKFRFYHNGLETAIGSLAYCSSTNKLYGTARPKTGRNFVRSNLILELDLSDYSYSYFTMGLNPINRIVLAHYDNCYRLFATEENSPVIHYKDLP